MEKLIIHKNQGEVIKCKLDIDGASTKDTIVRLCLEFDNNRNLFFSGKINEKGECSIPIPKLREIENSTGNSFIEVIAESVYFRVYETTFEIKNSVEVKMSEVHTTTNTKAKLDNTKVKLEAISLEGGAVITESQPSPPDKNCTKFQSYIQKSRSQTI